MLIDFRHIDLLIKPDVFLLYQLMIKRKEKVTVNKPITNHLRRTPQNLLQLKFLNVFNLSLNYFAILFSTYFTLCVIVFQPSVLGMKLKGATRAAEILKLPTVGKTQIPLMIIKARAIAPFGTIIIARMDFIFNNSR